MPTQHERPWSCVPWRATAREVDSSAPWASRYPFAIEYVEGSACAPIADVCDQPCAQANATIIAAAPELAEAIAAMPDDVDMVENNPDEGAHYFCCWQPYQHAQYRHASRPDPNKHAPGCWYANARTLLSRIGIKE